MGTVSAPVSKQNNSEHDRDEWPDPKTRRGEGFLLRDQQPNDSAVLAESAALDLTIGADAAENIRRSEHFLLTVG
jgi:hypothetical protein